MWGERVLALSVPFWRSLLLAACVLPTVPASAETFGQVLEQIAAAHPRIIAAQQLTRAGRADVRAAKSSYRPQFGIETDLGYSRGNNNSASGVALLPEAKISQLVYDGGRTPAEIRRRKLRVDQLGVQEQKALADVSRQLAAAWIDYARAAELIDLGTQQVAALQTLDRLVVEIASFDRGRASDVVMVESRLEQAQTALQTREISMAEARARIREVSALPVEPEGNVPDIGAALPETPESGEAMAAGSPAVRSADIEVAESAETVRGTKNWWMPQLAVEGARTSERTFDGDTRLFNGSALRLRATALPFDSGGGMARHEGAKAQLQSAQASADFTRTALAAQVRRLWTFQSQRQARLPSLIGLIARADDARNIVFEQFRLGRRTILDLLGYELERFNVRAQLVNERFDIAQTQYQMMGVLGRIYPAVAGEGAQP